MRDDRVRRFFFTKLKQPVIDWDVNKILNGFDAWFYSTPLELRCTPAELRTEKVLYVKALPPGPSRLYGTWWILTMT